MVRQRSANSGTFLNEATRLLTLLVALHLSSFRLAEHLCIDLPKLEAIARLTTTRERLVSTDDNRSFRRVR